MPQPQRDRGFHALLTLLGILIGLQGLALALKPSWERCDSCNAPSAWVGTLAVPIAGIMGALGIASVLPPEDKESFWFVVVAGFIVNIMLAGAWLFVPLIPLWLSGLVMFVGGGLVIVSWSS